MVAPEPPLSRSETLGYVAFTGCGGPIALGCLAIGQQALAWVFGLMALVTLAAWLYRSRRSRRRRSFPWAEVSLNWRNGELEVRAPNIDITIPGRFVPNAIALEQLAELVAMSGDRANMFRTHSRQESPLESSRG
jgi:hypothetical protein